MLEVAAKYYMKTADIIRNQGVDLGVE